jgi:hypothetical protein
MQSSTNPTRSTPANSAPESSSTQRGRILGLLIEARGGWVPSPAIAACAAQYNARIFELRRLGFEIVNRTEERDGIRCSCFRLVSTPSHADLSTPSDPGRDDAGNSQTPRARQEETLPLFPPEGNLR